MPTRREQIETFEHPRYTVKALDPIETRVKRPRELLAATPNLGRQSMHRQILSPNRQTGAYTQERVHSGIGLASGAFYTSKDAADTTEFLNMSTDLGNTDTTQTKAPESGPPAPLSLTPKAVQMVKVTRETEGLDTASGLRVAVRGGGCSGFEYALDFELEARDTDHVLEYDGLNVFVDPVSARYLGGTEIDYVLGPTGSGFKFNNPKATGSCGCGSSFSM